MRLQQEFEAETEELEQDIDRQLEGFHGFEGQQRRIETLQGRMQRKRRKLEDLEKRLGAVRDRVAEWERREGEWQAKITRRLRILWGTMAVLVLLVATFLVLQRWPARHNEHLVPWLPNNTVKIGRAGGSDGIHPRIPANVASILTTSATASRSRPGKGLEQAGRLQLDPDPRLRIFDEL